MLTSLDQILPQAATQFGDRTALHIEGQDFSFQQLDEMSTRLAVSLVELGISPGDRVTLYAGNSVEWIVSYYGVLTSSRPMLHTRCGAPVRTGILGG